VHVNLDDTYLVYRETGQPPPHLARIAGEGKKGSFYDLGERGERWLAVDHSGASGAAGLYVVYDVIKSRAMTVQDGNAPEVHAAIDRDVGRVRIGRRRMSFTADGLMVQID